MKRVLLLSLILLMSFGFVHAQDSDEESFFSRFDGENRFTVLFMGMDRRPDAGKSLLNVRTDAMILVSFDPSTESIGMMHIPRDLHFAALDIEPLLRVNTLLMRGENNQEGSGPYYVLDTLQYNLGMYIDAYVLVDFQAFIDLVDALGGIEITTDYTISDPTYPSMDYGYSPFYLESGTHLLDGENALKFARTRHGDNDYVRGVRQMEVVKAVARKATDPTVLPSLIASAPQLLDSLKNSVFTDLTIEDALPLAQFVSGIDEEKITIGSINEAYIEYFYQDGDSIAIPDREKLEGLLIDIFGENYGG